MVIFNFKINEIAGLELQFKLRLQNALITNFTLLQQIAIKKELEFVVSS